MRIFLKKLFCFISFFMYRIKITGSENIPKEGGALICPNHVHALDCVAFVIFAKRKVNILAKESLFENKVLKWLGDVFGAYPVKQNSADLGAIKTSLKILKNNELLLIFPEGTRNGLKKGKPVKNGAVTIALKAGVPIIPVGINGTFKWLSKVKINIGKPIYFSNKINKENEKEEITNMTNELMNEIIRLRDI